MMCGEEEKGAGHACIDAEGRVAGMKTRERFSCCPTPRIGSGKGRGAGWGTRKPLETLESACQEAVTGGDFPLVSAGRVREDSWGEGGAGEHARAPRGQQRAVGTRNLPHDAPLDVHVQGGEPSTVPLLCECARERHCAAARAHTRLGHPLMRVRGWGTSAAPQMCLCTHKGPQQG